MFFVALAVDSAVFHPVYSNLNYMYHQLLLGNNAAVIARKPAPSKFLPCDSIIFTTPTDNYSLLEGDGFALSLNTCVYH